MSSHTIATPTSAPGAIAVVSLHAHDLDETLAAVGLPALRVGEVRLADLLGVDRGLVARWSQERVDLTPHAGRRLVGNLSRALEAAGVPRAMSLEPEAMYPEATSRVEARMLDALSRAASPRAIDLLLDQPRRWEGVDAEAADSHLADARALSHLIEPPLVVAVGAANVGKSTLVNALAGRSVSIVADEPGVTRDCVGVLLELDGVCVRYLDAPGLSESDPPDELDAAARRVALDSLVGADLVLLCADATAPPPDPRTLPIRDGVPVLRVATRTDLGETPGACDARVCAIRGEGLGELAVAVRATLVPDSALADPRPWRFWAVAPPRP
ncbi:MAG: GTPase [Phycisphaerales bacterium]